MKIYGNDGNVIIGNTKYKVIKNEGNILTLESNGLKYKVPVIGSNSNELEIDETKISLEGNSKPISFYSITSPIHFTNGVTSDGFLTWGNGKMNGKNAIYFMDETADYDNYEWNSCNNDYNTLLIRVRNFVPSSTQDWSTYDVFFDDVDMISDDYFEYRVMYGAKVTGWEDKPVVAPLVLYGIGGDDKAIALPINEGKDYATVAVRFNAYSNAKDKRHQYTLDGKTWIDLPDHDEGSGNNYCQLKDNGSKSSGQISVMAWNKFIDDLSIYFPQEKQTIRRIDTTW